jgi:hypothetical protein
MTRPALMILLAWLMAAALVGCGGGDPEPEFGQKSVNPPNCAGASAPCS